MHFAQSGVEYVCAFLYYFSHTTALLRCCIALLPFAVCVASILLVLALSYIEFHSLDKATRKKHSIKVTRHASDWYSIKWSRFWIQKDDKCKFCKKKKVTRQFFVTHMRLNLRCYCFYCQRWWWWWYRCCCSASTSTQIYRLIVATVYPFHAMFNRKKIHNVFECESVIK